MIKTKIKIAQKIIEEIESNILLLNSNRFPEKSKIIKMEIPNNSFKYFLLVLILAAFLEVLQLTPKYTHCV